jgi:hypothetical protein
MLRTASSQAWLIGLLATMASFCALNAFGEQPYSVVAQSTKATAATGRKPIAQRLAASNLPVRPQSANACSEKGCPAPGSAPMPALLTKTDAAPAPEPAPVPQLAPAPQPDSPPEPAAADEAAEPVVDAALPAPSPAHATMRPAGAAKQTRAVPRQPHPESVRQTLFDRVTSALTGKPKMFRPAARVAIPSGSTAMPPMPKPVPQEIAAVMTDDEPLEIPEIAKADDGGTDAAPADVEPPANEIASNDDETNEAELIDTALEARDAVESADAGAPARLEFEVHESRSHVSEGEQVIMRIAVHNVGGEAAEGVHATLYFADGMEPVRAIGHSAEVLPGEVRFEQVPQLGPGSSVDLLVAAIGTRPGHVIYRGEVQCRQLPGKIAREGALTVRARKPLK